MFIGEASCLVVLDRHYRLHLLSTSTLADPCRDDEHRQPLVHGQGRAELRRAFRGQAVVSDVETRQGAVHLGSRDPTNARQQEENREPAVLGTLNLIPAVLSFLFRLPWCSDVLYLSCM